jgi:hypothetical protein
MAHPRPIRLPHIGTTRAHSHSPSLNPPLQRGPARPGDVEGVLDARGRSHGGAAGVTTSPLPSDVMAFAATFLSAVDRCSYAPLRGGVVAECVATVARTAQSLLYWCLERGPRWGAEVDAPPPPGRPAGGGLFGGVGRAGGGAASGSGGVARLTAPDAEWVWALVVCANDAALLTDGMEAVTGPRIAALSPEQVNGARQGRRVIV